MVRFLIFLVFIFISFLGYSQGKLKTYIYSEENVPLEFASVRLFTVADSTSVNGAYSDEKGLAVIEKIPFGAYYAIVSFFGYEDYIISPIEFSLKKNKIDLERIYLKSLTSQDLEEVQIKAEREVIQTSFDKKVYNLEEDMSAQGGAATDILNNIPSVEVDNDGNISLRGSGNVTILIDGRPSSLTRGAEGALDGIPASSIERIELVTNPSAKYDPDGTAGIINIVLKKNKLRGSNTSVDLTAASGDLYNIALNHNYRNEKVNVFANYSYRYQDGYRNNMNDRFSNINDTLYNLFQDRSGTDLRKTHTGKVGVDYNISSNQIAGLSVSGSYGDRIRTGNQFNVESFDNQVNRYWLRETIDPRNRASIDINADYKLDLKDNTGDFIVVLTQSIGETYSYGEYEEFFFRPNGVPFANNRLYQFQDGEIETSTFTGSADFQRNIGENFRYETGAKVIIRDIFRSNYLENLDTITGEVVPNFNVINDFSFAEDIYSLYGIAAHKMGDFKYQVGVRIEQAFTQPRLLTTNEDFENNYFSFFPSAHLIYGDDKTGEYSLSYSRRINRPNSWHLNPFPVFSDPLNLRMGNPALQPEYINSFELGYQKKWDKLTFSSSVYFRETVDKIQRVRQFFPDGVSINTFANIDESYDYGVELIGIYSPFKWWKNVISFNGYESRLAANINGVNLRNSGISYSLKLNSTFNIWKGNGNIQVNSQYIAPTFTVQGYYQRFAGIDIGINRFFMDKKLMVGIRLTDILDQQGFYLQVSDGPFTQESMYKWETRRLYLNVSYKFGKMNSSNSKKQSRGSNGGGGDDF